MATRDGRPPGQRRLIGAPSPPYPITLLITNAGADLCPRELLGLILEDLNVLDREEPSVCCPLTHMSGDLPPLEVRIVRLDRTVTLQIIQFPLLTPTRMSQIILVHTTNTLRPNTSANSTLKLLSTTWIQTFLKKNGNGPLIVGLLPTSR